MKTIYTKIKYIYKYKLIQHFGLLQTFLELSGLFILFLKIILLKGIHGLTIKGYGF